MIQRPGAIDHPEALNLLDKTKIERLEIAQNTSEKIEQNQEQNNGNEPYRKRAQYNY